MDHDNHQLGNVFREVFADFEQKPDPNVWKGLSRQLFIRRLLKITYSWIVPGLTVTALAVWMFFPNQESNRGQKLEQATPVVLNPVSAPIDESQTIQDDQDKQVVAEAKDAAVPKKATGHEPGRQGSGKPVSEVTQSAVVHGNTPAPVVDIASEPQATTAVRPQISEHQPVNHSRVNKPASVASENEPKARIVPATEEATVPVTETRYAICMGEEVSLTAPEGWRYNWSTGDFARNITVKPLEDAVYEVTVEDRQGNRSVARFLISILDCSIFVPRAFSPNDDGSNDQFVVRAEGIGQFEMKVFSKWGELVFENRDISQGWDGRIKGNRAPVDAYIYQIRFTDEAGNWHHVQGTVTLIP